MLFYGKNYSVVYFYVRNAIVSLYFTNIIKDDFPEKSYDTNALLIKKFYM